MDPNQQLYQLHRYHQLQSLQFNLSKLLLLRCFRFIKVKLRFTLLKWVLIAPQFIKLMEHTTEAIIKLKIYFKNLILPAISVGLIYELYSEVGGIDEGGYEVFGYVVGGYVYGYVEAGLVVVGYVGFVVEAGLVVVVAGLVVLTGLVVVYVGAYVLSLGETTFIFIANLFLLIVDVNNKPKATLVKNFI